ncbi:MAG: HEAT repeat domain-containing protein [Planctomycetota bacterium]
MYEDLIRVDKSQFYWHIIHNLWLELILFALKLYTHEVNKLGSAITMVVLKLSYWSTCLLLWGGIILSLSGCGDSFNRKMTLSDLESTNPTIRIMAIKWAGDNKISQAVPQLVDSLQNEDKSVRFYSIEALRRIVGTDHGYDYKTAPHLRATAVKRWREFLDTSESLCNTNEVKNYEY